MTTVTDLGVDILGQPDLQRLIGGIVNDSAFPARVVTYALPAAHGQAWDPAQVADAFHALRSQQTDRWRLGGIKLVADGSIQGWTAVLNPPGYRDGSPGIWMVSPEEMLRSVPVFHAAGINVHCHANGSAVIDAFCDAVEWGRSHIVAGRATALMPRAFRPALPRLRLPSPRRAHLGLHGPARIVQMRCLSGTVMA